MWHEFFAYLGKHDSVIGPVLVFLATSGGTLVALVKILDDHFGRIAAQKKQEKLDAKTALERESEIEASNLVLSGAMETDARNRIILDALPGALIVADKNLIIEQWNDGACALLGWTEHEAVGKSVLIIIPEEMRAAHRAGFAKYLETGAGVILGEVIPLEALHKNGRLLGVTLAVNPALTPSSEKMYVALILPQTTSIK